MGFIECSEKDLESGTYSPINVVFTLVTHKDRYLFVHRRQWDIWEIPVGEVTAGETHAECAYRRCMEESGQSIVNLKLFGLLEMRFERQQEPNYCAVFTAATEQELPFFENDDVTEISFITSLTDVTPICMTCRNIVQYYEIGKTDLDF